MPAEVRRFGSSLQSLDEPVLLQLALPSNRAPPEQGAIVDLDTAEVREPRAPEEAHGFDERGWLRRQGVHVVLRARAWTSVGHRGGIGGAADALRIWIRRPLARALSGERLAVVAGVVLGADEGLSDELKSEFRASGLYHLLAVSGQNVVFIVVGVLLITWLLALPRWLGHVAAIATIGAYVLAVGLQPSVVRAAVAGVLGSLAWLAARPTDRWYFLLLGAAALLAWNPYSLLDPGFQLSFAAVVAIFVAVPWIERRLEGYPLPRKLATVLAVSTACGVATAPIVLLEFGQVPIYSVVANAFAEPVVGPLLGLALISAVLDPLVPSAATALASLDGWLAAYLAACARLVARLPYAQVSSVRALGLLAALAALVAVSRLPPHIPLAVGRRNR
jgi:competence protein ComEC